MGTNDIFPGGIQMRYSLMGWGNTTGGESSLYRQKWGILASGWTQFPLQNEFKDLWHHNVGKLCSYNNHLTVHRQYKDKRDPMTVHRQWTNKEDHLTVHRPVHRQKTNKENRLRKV